MPKPQVFVGSSSEGRVVAHTLQEALEARFECEVTVWDQGVFRPSSYPVPALIAQAQASDFAVLVATRDDELTKRDTVNRAVRDNVLFELGLFVGVLGMERTFVLEPFGADGPATDLQGLTAARYDQDRENLLAALGPAAQQIGREVGRLGFRATSYTELSPPPSHGGSEEERLLAQELEMLTASAHAQGWRIKRTETALRLISPKNRRFTFTLGRRPGPCREDLRPFAQELRSFGLRIPHQVRSQLDLTP